MMTRQTHSHRSIAVRVALDEFTERGAAGWRVVQQP
jgi:hypothetical protein